MEESATILDPHLMKAVAGLPGRNGPSLLAELFELYLRDESERLARMARLLETRDVDSLANEAHHFGGNAASFGGIEVRSVAIEFERSVRQGDWPASAEGFEMLGKAAVRLRSEIARVSSPVR